MASAAKNSTSASEKHSDQKQIFTARLVTKRVAIKETIAEIQLTTHMHVSKQNKTVFQYV